MIDWYSIIFGALWIFGMGLIVTSLSFANYLANQQELPFMKVLVTPPNGLLIDLGFMLFCLGWAGLTSGWERIIWGILTLVFIVRTGKKRKIRYT